MNYDINKCIKKYTIWGIFLILASSPVSSAQAISLSSIAKPLFGLFRQPTVQKYIAPVLTGITLVGIGTYYAYKYWKNNLEKQKIQTYLNSFPEPYRKKLNNYLAIKKIQFSSLEDARAASFQILSNHILNDNSYYNKEFNNKNGYTYIPYETYGYLNLVHFTENRNQLNLKSLVHAKERDPYNTINIVKEGLIENYKIHLMPKENDISKVLINLLETIENNPNIKSKIYTLKLKYNLDSKELLERLPNKEVLPTIVIYPESKKSSAQEVLNCIYEKFKDTQGMDITPRFNERITSLIYYSQGDGDSKNEENYNDYYEMPKKIFYNWEKFVKEERSFKLDNPNGNVF